MEFEFIGAKVASTLGSFGYKSYTVVMTHAGYDYLDAVPVIVAIAKIFVPFHAEQIQAEFYRMDKCHLHEIFLYNGIKQADGRESRIQTHAIKARLRAQHWARK